MPRQISYEEWAQEQRERDPGWDRFLRGFLQTVGPKRKVPLLLDKNLEADFVAELRAVKDFRITSVALGQRPGAAAAVLPPVSR